MRFFDVGFYLIWLLLLVVSDVLNEWNKIGVLTGVQVVALLRMSLGLNNI